MSKRNTDAMHSDRGMIRRLFQKFFFSSLLAILCSCIGSIVGNIVVGNAFSEEKLAVMSLTLPVYYVFATIGNLLGIGGSALCAKLIGKQRHADCKKAFTVTYLLSAVLCLFFMALFLPLLPSVVRLLGTPESLTKDVTEYCTVTILGGFFTCGIYLSFNFLRLSGKLVASVMSFLMMAVLNVVLDIVLVPMGVAGVAVATVVGSAAATVFGILMLRHSDMLRFTRVGIREGLSLAASVLRIGSPGATENISILLKSYLFVRIIRAALGSAALSTLSVVNSVNSLSMAITVGCAGALVPMVGVFSSERDTVSIRRLIGGAFLEGFLLLLIFTAAIFAFAPTVASLFGVKTYMAQAATAIRLFSLSLPAALLSNVLIYLHLSDGHTAVSNILTALRCFVFAVLTAFGMIRAFGETGLWLSFLASELLTLVAALALHAVAKQKNPNLSFWLLIDRKFEKAGASLAICCGDSDDEITEAMTKIEDFCDSNDLMPKRAMLLKLSIEEMAHMAAEHSTKHGKTHIISIRVLVHEDLTVIRLRYRGRMFNPIEYYESKKSDKTDIDAMLALADCLGMKLITDACDVVDYRTTFGLNNLTILI